MKVFYSDFYTFNLPEDHRFPALKYALLREQLLAQGILSPQELLPSPLATREAVTLAHTPEYFDAIYTGSIDPKSHAPDRAAMELRPGAAFPGGSRRFAVRRR